MSKSFHHNGEENWTQAQNLRAKARRLRARARATH
jgi:hypothetical protein